MIGLAGISTSVVCVVFIIHQVQRRRLYCSAPPGSKMGRTVSNKGRRSASYQSIASAMPPARLRTAPSGAESQRRLAYFTDRRDAMLSDIRELTELESPNDNKPAVETLADVATAQFA